MYHNLKRQLRINKINNTQLSELWGISTVSVSKKINGHVPITTDEMVALKQKFFPYISMDYLTEKDKDGESEVNGKTD